MTDPINLPLNPQSRLYDPPLIDHLNRETNCYAIEFIPDNGTDEEKSFV